jgi:hypothetical protein
MTGCSKELVIPPDRAKRHVICVGLKFLKG